MIFVKNYFVILSFCIFIEFLVWGKEIEKAEMDAWIDDCLSQVNTTTEPEKPIDPAESGCFVACMVKKLGETNETLHHIVESAITEVKDINSKLFDQAMDKLDKCSKKVGGDDCKLMDCIDLFDTPFSKLLQPQTAKELH